MTLHYWINDFLSPDSCLLSHRTHSTHVERCTSSADKHTFMRYCVALYSRYITFWPFRLRFGHILRHCARYKSTYYLCHWLLAAACQRTSTSDKNQQ